LSEAIVQNLVQVVEPPVEDPLTEEDVVLVLAEVDNQLCRSDLPTLDDMDQDLLETALTEALTPLLTKLGGPGSGFYGHSTPSGTPKGGGSTARSGVGSVAEDTNRVPAIIYDTSAKARSTPSNHEEAIGSAGAIDAALAVPVDYFNAIKGLKVEAACEGHEEEWMKHDGLLGHPAKDEFGTLTVVAQEAYIKAELQRGRESAILSQLTRMGFQPGSSTRNVVIGDIAYQHSQYFRNRDNGTHMVFDLFTRGTRRSTGIGGTPITEHVDNKAYFSVATGKIDMSKAKVTGSLFWKKRNASYSYENTKALDKTSWDKARDSGFTAWMGLLSPLHK
jgi:hypothetical protein